MSTQRLDVRKTRKLCIGGQFVRSESGRVLAARSADGQPLDNFSWASRKDLRDAVVAARGALDGWAKRTAYLRSQILYRAAEMLEKRAAELAGEIARSTGARGPNASAEVTAAIDRLVHYAGWTDKFAQVFGSVNPVATPHFNFTVPEPTGVVAVFAPDEPSLVAFVTLVASAILSGNTIVAIASDRFPLPALAFAEVLATSDFPAGAVNILAGKQSELAPHAASHMDINAIVDGSSNRAVVQILQAGPAHNLKRYTRRSLKPDEWFSAKTEDPYWILDTTEFKTAWHPIGV
jgi:acyl-CoA reductase-like NAD-dependent aldehyde dehydrogenase